MTAFLEALRKGPLLADGAMGSYLFELTGRLSEENHVYEAFGADRPEVLRQVGLAYLQAGSRCLTTNTFAGNHACLAAAGLGHRTAELSAAAAAVARDAIDEYCRAAGEDRERFFVLGSVGPTPAGDESGDALDEAYADHLAALVAGGVDALLLETFRSLDQLLGVLNLVSRQAPGLPVIAQMALQQDGEGWSVDPLVFARGAADAGAHVIGINCCTPWEAERFVAQAAGSEEAADRQLLLSAMPNAGGFQHIGNRYMTRVNPEFMGRLGRTLCESGASLVGGCCEIHPPHVAEMASYLRSRAAGARSVAVEWTGEHPPASRETKAGNGGFSRRIFGGGFAVSVELLPPRGTAPKQLQGRVDFVGRLAASGLADALDITDGSRGIPLMPPGDFVHLLRRRLGWSADEGDGLELIPHFTSRDLNLMGVQARLIGYWANRIHNVLFITGDPPKMAPTYPRSTAVFDIDSVEMVRLTHTRLNAGLDFGGQPLGRHRDPRTRFTIGTGFEPEAPARERELDKLRRKVDAGADYVMTQPVFRREALNGLEPFRERVAVLAGVLVLRGLDHALRMRAVPGMVVPDEVVERLGASREADDQARVGAEIAAGQIRRLRAEGWSGVYLMSPAGHGPVLEVLAAGLG